MPNPSDPQDFNRYSYVRNSPLKFIDPSGHYHYQAIHHDLTLKYARKVASNAHALAVTDDKGSWPGSHDEAMKKASTIADRNKGVDFSGRTSVNPINRSDDRPVGEYWHFTSLEDAESRLLKAVKAKDATAFGRALHAYQDYWSHPRKGFSFLSEDAGKEAIAKLCPECSTMMSKGLLQARSSEHGHLSGKWPDDYTPSGEIGTIGHGSESRKVRLTLLKTLREISLDVRPSKWLLITVKSNEMYTSGFVSLYFDKV